MSLEGAPSSDIRTDVAVGAYFYPLTQKCGVRASRAWDLRAELGELGMGQLNELQLAADAQPLFTGHDQPRTYCLDPAGRITKWDDADSTALMYQAALAMQHGLSYFIFTSYNGLRSGQPSGEFQPANQVIRETMGRLSMFGFRYAHMEVLEGPRALLPIPNSTLLRQDRGNAALEPDREYDVTPESARHLVDQNVEDWRSPGYLRLPGDHPYLSIMMPGWPSLGLWAKLARMERFITELRQYAYDRYDVLPYLAGVLRHPDDAGVWANLDVNAMTTYCALPDFTPGAPPIQTHDALLRKWEGLWEQFHSMAQSQDMPFVPTATVAWDASARGERGFTFDKVKHLHPYAPIVICEPDDVAEILTSVIDFTAENVPAGQRLATLFAWNEVTEGAVLLPRAHPDGTVDMSYLQAVSRVIHEHARCGCCKPSRAPDEVVRHPLRRLPAALFAQLLNPNISSTHNVT